jgi:putative ABC transport system permease protein
MNDFRHAIRRIVLRPGQSLLVIAMLALGIGATTAMFTNYYTILIEPLNVPEPDRLVLLGAPGPKHGAVRAGLGVGNPEAVFSYPLFRELEAEQAVFTGLAAHSAFLADFAWRQDSHAGTGVLVSGRYFDVLQLQPALGRLIGPNDEPRTGEEAVVVLSHAYWQSRFGGDPEVIGEPLIVNNQALTIIGVAPEGFTGTMPAWVPSVFVPLTMHGLMQPEEARRDDDRLSHWLYLFARLSPGVSSDQAAASLNRYFSAVLAEIEAPLLTGLSEEQRARFLARELTLEPGGRGQTYAWAQAVNPLSLLLGSTIVVLLIVCVNLANLMLARGAGRAGEFAIRASMGAGRGRLIVLLLAEAAVLAALAGLLSLPVALATLRFMVAAAPSMVTNVLADSLSGPALSFAAATTVATLLVFALVPAVRASDTSPGRALQGLAVQHSGTRGLARSRSALIGVQIALGMMLVVVAGLFTQSLANVARVEPGFSIDGVVSFSVAGALGGYSGHELDTLYDAITRALEAEPGVASVASAAIPIMSGLAIGGQVSVPGADAPTPPQDIAQSKYMTSPRFFETLGIPLLTGRDFTPADSEGSQSVAIVNQAFARRFGLESDAIGRFFRFAAPYLSSSDIEIVGVVADAYYSELRGTAQLFNHEVPPQVFTPRPLGDQSFGSQFYYVRSTVDPDALMRTIRQVVARIDPAVPVRDLTTLRAAIRDRTAGDRLLSALSGSFALLAILLAGTGVYSVLSYSVAQRTRELGLRLALGARPSQLGSLVLRQITRIALIAGAVGLAGAVLLGRLIQSALYGLSGHDPIVLVVSVAALAGVIFLAAWMPARHAARVAPMEALRYQ